MRLPRIICDGPKCHHTCPLKRKAKEDNADTQEKGHMKTEWREMNPTSEGLLTTPGAVRGRGEVRPERFQKNQSPLIPWFKVSNLQTVNEYVSDLSHPDCGDLFRKPWGLNTPGHTLLCTLISPNGTHLTLNVWKVKASQSLWASHLSSCACSQETL